MGKTVKPVLFAFSFLSNDPEFDKSLYASTYVRQKSWSNKNIS